MIYGFIRQSNGQVRVFSEPERGATGRPGLKMLQTNARIDLLITDVGRPGGMNGRQRADAHYNIGSRKMVSNQDITSLLRRQR